MEYGTRGEIEHTGQIVLLIFAGCHDFLLCAFGSPCRTDPWQQMDIEFIDKHHHVMGVQWLRMKTNPGQALDPLGVVIFGDQFGPFPDPAQFTEPPPHGPSRDGQAMFGREFDRQGRATLPRPAPAIGTCRRLE